MKLSHILHLLLGVHILFALILYLWYNCQSLKFYGEKIDMKIVIIGVGNIGEYIAKNLTKEGHEVIVVDKDYEKVNSIVNEYDIKGICGSGELSEIQMEVDAAHADLVISVSNYDEINIISSLVAKSLGAKSTIARIRRIEYNRQFEFMRDNFGIDKLFNPEKETAQIIAQLLQFPYALNVVPFAGGKLNGLTIEIPEDCNLVGIRIGDIEETFDVNIVVYAVQQDQHVIIPDEDYIIQPNDIISILAKPDVMRTFSKKIGLKNRVKNVMIMNGGRMAYYLSQALSENKISVQVVERDKQICDEISANFNDVSIVLTNSSDYNTLQEIGLENIDAFVPLSSDDEENIVLSLYAKSRGIKNIVTRIEDDKLTKIAQNIGLNKCISSKTQTAMEMIKFTRNLIREQQENNTLLSLSKMLNERGEVIEFEVDDNKDIIYKPLKKLKLVKDIVIACIIRDQEIIVPNSTDMLMVGDKIIVITRVSHLSSLENILR